METKFNFNSQICTSRSQSERLLSLGLKKETADMCYKVTTHDWRGHEIPEKDKHYSLCSWYDELNIVCGFEQVKTIPAWSLHRLFQIYTKGVVSSSWNMAKFNWDDLIDCIEDSIVKGYFNKEYLV